MWDVSASGFFTDSYNLFATNVILPSLAFVYWPLETDLWRQSLIQIMTLVGSLLGQLLFGFLADSEGSIGRVPSASWVAALINSQSWGELDSMGLS